MGVNLSQLLNDFKIPFKTSGAEITRGWIGLSCPWCGDGGNHLGYNQEKDLLTCWKCGPKRMIPTLKLLLEVPVSEVENIVKNYGVISKKSIYESEGFSKNQKLVMPSEFGEIQSCHKKYLLSRGYNWKDIVSRWHILGTTNCKSYANRIIIPIYYQGKLVSYHSRDITGEANTPKKACNTSDEVIHFKNLLYGYDQVKSNTVIVTEGPFDVWRFGRGAVCTFGIKFTEHQVELLSTFKNIFIVFDSSDAEENNKEEQAQKQAERLANKLSIFQNTWIVSDLGSDPGKMKQRKADRIKAKILQIAEKNNIQL